MLILNGFELGGFWVMYIFKGILGWKLVVVCSYIDKVLGECFFFYLGNIYGRVFKFKLDVERVGYRFYIEVIFCLEKGLEKEMDD